MPQLQDDVEAQATTVERVANVAGQTVRKYAAHLHQDSAFDAARRAEDRVLARIALKRLQTEVDALVIWVDELHDALAPDSSQGGE